MVRRYDSPKADDKAQQSLHHGGALLDIPRGVNKSPRISTLGSAELREAHSAQNTESNLNKQNLHLQSQQDFSALDRNAMLPETEKQQHEAGSSKQHQEKGQDPMKAGAVDLPQQAEQGSFVLPKLRGQGSSMRGDLWLPQQWQEQRMTSSPRDKMHAAMEAVRAAERAVQAAAVLSPSRCMTLCCTMCATAGDLQSALVMQQPVNGANHSDIILPGNWSFDHCSSALRYSQ